MRFICFVDVLPDFERILDRLRLARVNAVNRKRGRALKRAAGVTTKTVALKGRTPSDIKGRSSGPRGRKPRAPSPSAASLGLGTRGNELSTFEASDPRTGTRKKNKPAKPAPRGKLR